jgi:peptidylprolyl isomerase domain and WD repeat-containing protein 1
MLAVSDTLNPIITIYDGRADNAKPMHTIEMLHRSVIHLMAFNNKYNCVISCDESGMVEYWSPRPERDFEKPDIVFEYKSNTGLFEFKKSKSVPTSLTLSPTQESFVTFSYPDRLIRVFDFPTAKLTRTYDESLPTLTTLQQALPPASKLPDLEFGRRMALESSLDFTALQKANIVFDETGNFIIFGSLSGIKILNITTSILSRTLARDENIRPLHLALYQGAPQKKSVVTVEMAASANPLLEEAAVRDPTIFCTAAQKQRFYVFTNDSTASKSERDVFNEKPTSDPASGSSKALERKPGDTGAAAIVHTTMGDVHLRLFPEAAPKTVENFVTHAKNGYYNGTMFHRVVKKFMIQGGDPMGDGTGGESIWGGEFEDEFSTLRHDKPYTLSSANYGPNTNGSQFFITTDKTVCVSLLFFFFFFFFFFSGV